MRLPDGQLEPAVHVDRLVVLADLVVLRHVRVEVVLPVEEAGLHLAVQGLAEPDGQLDDLLVEHRQAAGQAEAHRADVGVGLVAEAVGAAAEDLGGRGQLGVDLEAHDDLEPSTSPSAPIVATRRYGLGGGHALLAAASSTAATRNISGLLAASARGPARRPAGRPRPVPNGTLMAGWPARFDGIVQTSDRYMARGFSVLAPSGKATDRRGRRQQQVDLLVGPRRSRRRSAGAPSAPCRSRRRSSRPTARRCRA